MKLENIQDKKFGKLRVIRRIANGKNGHSRWECLCECGNYKDYTGMELKKLKTINCGCEPNIPKNFKDLTGMDFGDIKVIEKIGYKENGTKKTTLWKCLCKCGNYKNIDSGALNSGHAKSCGCKQFGKMNKHPNWKGGKRTRTSGYIDIREPNHPNAKWGYVYEHVYVMSKILGRPLKKGENVHHKNGIRNDNRPENLELWTTVHPCGQRVEDMIEFCLNYLKEYNPNCLVKNLRN